MEWEKMLDFSQRVSKLLNNKFESFFPNNRLICRGAINIHSCIKFHGWQFQGKTHNNNNKYVVDWQPRHIKRCYPMITCEPSWANICQLSFFPNYIIGTTRAWQWAGSSHDIGYTYVVWETGSQLISHCIEIDFDVITIKFYINFPCPICSTGSLWEAPHSYTRNSHDASPLTHQIVSVPRSWCLQMSSLLSLEANTKLRF